MDDLFWRSRKKFMRRNRQVLEKEFLDDVVAGIVFGDVRS
jgi:hypothetical protein